MDPLPWRLLLTMPVPKQLMLGVLVKVSCPKRHRRTVPKVTANYQQFSKSNPAAATPDASTKTGVLPDADFLKATSGNASPAAPSGMPDADFLAATGAAPPGSTPSTAALTPPTTPSGPSQAPTQPGWHVADIVPGIERGLRDVIDPMAEGLSSVTNWGANKLGVPNAPNQVAGALGSGINWLGSQVGVPNLVSPQVTPTAVAAGDQQTLHDYSRDYGTGHPLATLGRVGGEAALALPLLTTGAGVAGSAADVAGAGAGRVAPVLGGKSKVLLTSSAAIRLVIFWFSWC